MLSLASQRVFSIRGFVLFPRHVFLQVLFMTLQHMFAGGLTQINSSELLCVVKKHSRATWAEP